MVASRLNRPSYHPCFDENKAVWCFNRRRLNENQLLISFRKINKQGEWCKQAPNVTTRTRNELCYAPKTCHALGCAWFSCIWPITTHAGTKQSYEYSKRGKHGGPSVRRKFCDPRYIFNLVPWSCLTLFVVLTLRGIVEHCESSTRLLSLKCH